MKFSKITYCTGIVTSGQLQPRCKECARQRPLSVDSDVVARWITDKPALATDCEAFRAALESK